jgi:parallel beta-helix repeat protein
MNTSTLSAKHESPGVPASAFRVRTSALRLLSFFLFCLSSGLTSQAENLNVLDMGATPDGRALNTTIIQKAIDQCYQTGGGEVVFPQGKYLIGSIILKSGVCLNLQKGATLLGSTNLEDYQPVKPKYVALRTGQQTIQLIFAEGQENISIIGQGTIDGQGKAFVRDGNDEGILRPHVIQFINCKNVKIEGIFMTNSGAWMQHYLACDNLQIRGIRVYNHCNANNDGIDIDGCHDVIISDCIIDSDDDGICLKSTSPRLCRNVIVSNCIIHSHCNSLKLGTESTGGFQNIRFSNCLVSPSEKETCIYGLPEGQSAISVEMVDGGILDQVSIDHITILETRCPVFIRLGNRARKYTPEAPQPAIGSLGNVSITNVVATTSSKTTSNITGMRGAYAENIYLGNIQITNKSSGTVEDAAIVVPEKDEVYPTSGMFGDVLPASAFFVRHVKNITFDNVRLIMENENVLPAFVLDDVQDVSIRYPQLRTSSKIELADQKDCQDVQIVNQ